MGSIPLFNTYNSGVLYDNPNGSTLTKSALPHSAYVSPSYSTLPEAQFIDPNTGQYQTPGVLGSETSYSGSGGTSGGSTAPAIDTKAVALYDQGIAQTNNQIGRLSTQQTNALAALLGQYNTGLSGLNTTKARTDADYNQNKTQSTQQNIQANSNIDFSTGRQANSLQRLLGARGAGSSSASRVAAPYAAALQGTQQRNQVKDAYSQNMNSLDTSYGRFNEDWNNSMTGLDRQYETGQKTTEASVAEKRQSLLQTLATLTSQRQLALTGDPTASVAAAQPYLDQINQLGTQIDQLGTPSPISVQNPTYAAPDLAKYDYDRTASPQFSNGSALQETISPYLSLLLKGKKNQQPLV